MHLTAVKEDSGHIGELQASVPPLLAGSALR